MHRTHEQQESKLGDNCRFSERSLRLSDRDNAGLRWLLGRCAIWRFGLKRELKYSQHKATFSPEEIELHQVVMRLERDIKKLMELT